MEFWKKKLKEIGVFENCLWIGVLKIIWKLEFWKLNLKEIGVLKINWELEFWKLILKEIGVLEIIWELVFWKLNLRLRVLEIKFERNWSFKN